MPVYLLYSRRAKRGMTERLYPFYQLSRYKYRGAAEFEAAGFRVRMKSADAGDARRNL